MNQLKHTCEYSVAYTLLRKKETEREARGPIRWGGPRVRETPPSLRNEESLAGRAGKGFLHVCEAPELVGLRDHAGQCMGACGRGGGDEKEKANTGGETVLSRRRNTRRLQVILSVTGRRWRVLHKKGA